MTSRTGRPRPPASSTDDVDAEFRRPPAERLRQIFGPRPPGAMLDDVLRAAETASPLLFDPVEQVRMETGHSGRVVLLGDAAWCVTLYAGMGVSSGLTGAELLGAMPDRHPGDVPAALTAWEHALRPCIDHYLDGAGADRRVFVVNTEAEIRFRRAMPRLRRAHLGRRLVDRLMRVDEIAKYKNADNVGEVLNGVRQHAAAGAADGRERGGAG